MNPLFLVCTLFSILVAGSSVIDHRAIESSLSPRADNLVFTASKWIWTATTVASAPRAFRKDFTPPLGKSLIAADIIIAADNRFTLYVNGEVIGSAAGDRWAKRFCVDLLPSFNVFAVQASTTAAANGALIATILVTYSDGTTDTIVSDSSWRASNTVPAGFEQLSFDDIAWPAATTVGAYGAATWGTVFVPTNPPTVSLTGATWIWTDVVPASGTLPAGRRAFRKTFVPASGQVPVSANIIITVDNAYTLYVNGVEVGTGSTWETAQHYRVNLAPASELVLAVLATNTVASAAGVLVSMEVNMVAAGRANCTAGVFVQSDRSWKSTTGAIPAGWQLPGFNDSAWPAAVAEAVYPATKWGTVSVAAASPPVDA
ncbi:hypothetical protein FB451DRAFT_1259459 [Mycena latifolia]|nr:hypothetical protein FB451DRAFT_1259459 [Mycena latifolia]